MTTEQFITDIAKYVQKYAPKYNIKVRSPIIAQAILESGRGTSELAVNANNYFGLKYRVGRCPTACGIYYKIGSEQNPDGSYTSSAMQWMKFPDMESCVIGYFDFTNISNYSNLKGVTDPETYLKNIKADGYASSLDYVKNVMDVVKSYNLTQYDSSNTTQGGKMGYTNSPLVDYVRISPNKTVNRTHAIDTVTIHCVVGQVTVERLGEIFAPTSRQASSNYGIGLDGKIGLYVEEKDRSWCSSNAANDHRAITIEVASDTTTPYAVTEKAYNALINLLADICRRNGIKQLLWKADKSLIGQVDKQNMTVHRWFAAKSCPGDYLYSRHGQIADEVNKKLGVITQQAASSTVEKSNTTTNKNFPNTPFTVNVNVPDLNIRSDASMSGTVKGVTGKGVFTITEVKNGWGKLKSNVGWIYLENASYVTIGSTSNNTSTSSTSQSSSTASTYTQTQFIKDIQAAIGTKVDGVAGSDTLSKTVTVSKTKNTKHAVVKPIQKYLYSIGYTMIGDADGVAGTKFETAVKAYQKANGCAADGEITAKQHTWKTLLGLR